MITPLARNPSPDDVLRELRPKGGEGPDVWSGHMGEMGTRQAEVFGQERRTWRGRSQGLEGLAGSSLWAIIKLSRVSHRQACQALGSTRCAQSLRLWSADPMRFVDWY